MSEKEPKHIDRADLHGPIAETIVDNLPDGLPKELRGAARDMMIVTAGMLEAMGAPEKEIAEEIAKNIHDDMAKDLSDQ